LGPRARPVPVLLWRVPVPVFLFRRRSARAPLALSERLPRVSYSLVVPERRKCPLLPPLFPRPLFVALPLALGALDLLRPVQLSAFFARPARVPIAASAP